MSKSESMRRVGSFLRKKKRSFTECNYTCKICGYSIAEQIEELDSRPLPTDSDKLHEFFRFRSQVLSQIQIHHILPLSKNGSNSTDNIQVLCESCHKQIHKELEEKELKRREKIKEKKGRKIKIIARKNKGAK